MSPKKERLEALMRILVCIVSGIVFGFIIWFCLEKKILNLKVFYLILLFIISIFFLDSLFQYFLGSNIFGQVSPLKYRITSFFGDEVPA